MRDITHIDGPINIARVQGEVNGIKKVLYLFMDIHFDLTQETKCSKLDGLSSLIQTKSVVEFLKDIIYEYKNNDKTYDLFIEMYDTELQNKNLIYVKKGRYIDEISDIFHDLFIFDVVKSDNNTKIKIKTNKEYSNFRWHYFDIRGRVNIFEVLDRSYKNISNSKNKEDQLNCLLILINELKKIKDIIYSDKKYRSSFIKKNIFYKHIQKIKEEYNNPTIKKILSDELKNIKYHLVNSLKILNDARLKIENIKLTDHNKLNKVLLKNLDSVNRSCESFFASLVDIIGLRRILDKDYIKNVLHYAGAYHSSFYIKVLVNKFNFKVTHIISTNPKKDVRTVKKWKSVDEVYRSIVPLNPVQCSNISNFPKIFS